MDDGHDDVMLLRDILVRELETINFYQSLHGRAGLPEVRAFISHVIDEEKEHVAEAIALINRLDPRQAARFADAGHWMKSPGLVSSPSVEVESEPQAERSSQVTVGSLRHRSDS